MKRFAIVMLATALVAGCSIFPKSFDPTMGQGLLIVGDQVPSGLNSYLFRKLNMETGRFETEMAQAQHFGGSPSAMGAAKNGTGTVFAAMPDADAGHARTNTPGYYAFVGIEHIGGGPQLTPHPLSRTAIVGFKCFNEGAAVIRLNAGEIALVAANTPPLPSETVALEFAEVRKRFPEMKGVAVVQDVAPKITFGSGEMERGSCLGQPNFSVIK